MRHGVFQVGRVGTVQKVASLGQGVGREVLGFWIGNSETYGSWNDFLAWLKGRGLRGMDLVVSDQHGGLVKAVETQFQEVMWQRYQTHFTRNILDACPKQLQSQLHSQLRVIWLNRLTFAGRFAHGERRSLVNRPAVFRYEGACRVEPRANGDDH